MTSWPGMQNGVYKVKEGYRWPRVEWPSILWYKFSMPRHSTCTWRLLLRKLPTQNVLQKSGTLLASRCSLYICEVETEEHLFVNCGTTTWFWAVLTLKLGKQGAQISSMEQLVDFFMKNFRGKGLCSMIGRVAFSAGIISIWEFRMRGYSMKSKQINCNF